MNLGFVAWFTISFVLQDVKNDKSKGAGWTIITTGLGINYNFHTQNTEMRNIYILCIVSCFVITVNEVIPNSAILVACLIDS